MANPKVINYLKKVENIRDKGYYRIPSGKVKDLVKDIDKDYQPCKKISHEGLELFVKHYGALYTYNPERQAGKFTSDIILSRLYNALGVNSATYYPMTTTKGIFDKQEIDLIVSQSILDIPSCTTKQAVADEKLNQIISVMCEDDTYSVEGLIHRRQEIAEYDKRFADNNFFGDFIGMHLLDNIFLQEDRTINNFFIYKDKKTGKSGIITYDHERLALDKFAFTSDEDFKNIIEGRDKTTFSPNSLCPISDTNESYSAKINNIAKILDSGILGHIGEEFKNRFSNVNFREILEDSERQGYSLSRDRVNKIRILFNNAQNEICNQKVR